MTFPLSPTNKQKAIEDGMTFIFNSAKNRWELFADSDAPQSSLDSEYHARRQGDSELSHGKLPTIRRDTPTTTQIPYRGGDNGILWYKDGRASPHLGFIGANRLVTSDVNVGDIIRSGNSTNGNLVNAFWISNWNTTLNGVDLSGIWIIIIVDGLVVFKDIFYGVTADTYEKDFLLGSDGKYYKQIWGVRAQLLSTGLSGGYWNTYDILRADKFNFSLYQDSEYKTSAERDKLIGQTIKNLHLRMEVNDSTPDSDAISLSAKIRSIHGNLDSENRARRIADEAILLHVRSRVDSEYRARKSGDSDILVHVRGRMDSEYRARKLGDVEIYGKLDSEYRARVNADSDIYAYFLSKSIQDWDALTSFKKDDIVNYEGGLYYAKVDVLANATNLTPRTDLAKWGQFGDTRTIRYVKSNLNATPDWVLQVKINDAYTTVNAPNTSVNYSQATFETNIPGITASASTIQYLGVTYSAVLIENNSATSYTVGNGYYNEFEILKDVDNTANSPTNLLLNFFRGFRTLPVTIGSTDGLIQQGRGDSNTNVFGAAGFYSARQTIPTPGTFTLGAGQSIKMGFNLGDATLPTGIETRHSRTIFTLRTDREFNPRGQIVASTGVDSAYRYFGQRLYTSASVDQDHSSYYWRDTRNCITIWNSAASYDSEEVVIYNGTTFRAIQPSTNVIPAGNTTQWAVFGGAEANDDSDRRYFKAADSDLNNGRIDYFNLERVTRNFNYTPFDPTVAGRVYRINGVATNLNYQTMLENVVIGDSVRYTDDNGATTFSVGSYWGEASGDLGTGAGGQKQIIFRDGVVRFKRQLLGTNTPTFTEVSNGTTYVYTKGGTETYNLGNLIGGSGFSITDIKLFPYGVFEDDGRVYNYDSEREYNSSAQRDEYINKAIRSFVRRTESIPDASYIAADFDSEYRARKEADSDINVKLDVLFLRTDSDEIQIQRIMTEVSKRLDSDYLEMLSHDSDLKVEIAEIFRIRLERDSERIIALRNADSDNLVYIRGRIDSEYRARKEGDSDLRVSINRVISSGVTYRNDSDIQVRGIFFNNDSEGYLKWNNDRHTLSLTVDTANNINVSLGEETVAFARNNSGVDIPKGSAVYISGAQGSELEITLASNATEMTSSGTFGVAAEFIGSGNGGWVQFIGRIYGLNTVAPNWNEGQPLWLGVNGALTTTKPLSPAHLVFVGWVTRRHANNGSIYVRVINGYELDELHDVLITNTDSDNVLIYNKKENLWQNKPMTYITGHIYNRLDSEYRARKSGDSDILIHIRSRMDSEYRARKDTDSDSRYPTTPLGWAELFNKAQAETTTFNVNDTINVKTRTTKDGVVMTMTYAYNVNDTINTKTIRTGSVVRATITYGYTAGGLLQSKTIT